MSRPGRLRALAARHQAPLDVAIAAVLVSLPLLGTVMGARHNPGRPLNTGDIVAALIAFPAIALRRRRPRELLLAVTATIVVFFAVTGTGSAALVIAVGVDAYTMALRTDRRTTWLLAVVNAVAFYVAATWFGDRGWWPPEVAGYLAYLGMVTAVGDATRSRRAYLAEVEERLRRAEQTREEEASRRVIQERLRIARELHDVIAHHIAVINVQAGAASHLLDRRPEQVRPALDHIRHAGDTVLQELGSIIGVLRRADDPATGSSDTATEPTRGLARLPELLDAAAAAGMAVDFRLVGAARELPAVVDLAAFRIVQEALTNAHKHGTGAAGLTVTYTPDGVGVEVVNAVAAGAGGTGSGYGLIGMRERAAAADGTLDAYATAAGRFAVHADLPAPAQPKETS